ncbi:MAG: 16S rRNA (cytidine(1402)-2'-O)-methyltransferase [Oxalobacter sp.]|nr:MAG: 16S rRNA (cytidine(1402)-2'-O)-methyltransferase [Oxalobacter sp.]
MIPVLAEEIAQQNYPSGALYIVATPIGNIADISLRALHVLSIVDAVACEDTRNTGLLLSRYGLSKPLVAAHEHNERDVAQRLITRMQAGARIALVSDAGTPGISDPGGRIVDAVRTAGLRVIPLPGAASPVAALSASGLVNDQFLFFGFLPSTASQRKQALAALRHQTATLVFLESPHRIAETLEALAQAFEPNRQIVIARELTKLFEEIHRCPLSEAIPWMKADPNRSRGEFVLLLEGAPATSNSTLADANHMLEILLAELPVSQAAALAARISGQKKNALYQRALEISAKKNKT